MPACGSPSICNLGVVRRRSFTAAAPEVAILAQSLSDGTLLTRVVCETAGCDFLFVVPLRLRSFDGSASPQCSKLVFSSQLLRFPSRSTSLILTVFRTTCRRISLLSLTTSLFLLPLPASSVMGTSPLLGLSLAASCSAALCPCTCSVTDLVHESSQSAVCPACNSQSPSSLDFLHFQHLCCVHHMEAPAGMICSSPQSFASSFSVPCCRQRIHYECLARSVHTCGDHCPFCTQDFVPVLTLFWQPSNTSTFPSTSTRPLSIHSTLLCP